MQGQGLGAPRSIETLGEAILNLSGQIDLPVTLETSHYLFINFQRSLKIVYVKDDSTWTYHSGIIYPVIERLASAAI